MGKDRELWVKFVPAEICESTMVLTEGVPQFLQSSDCLSCQSNGNLGETLKTQSQEG